NHENLDGEPLAKAASGLQKSATKFETILNDFLSGSDPSVRELEGLLKTPAKLLPLNPRLSPQKRPMVITSKPATVQVFGQVFVLLRC
ncbi:MAG: hypothetical protein DMG97_31865, partial [Acidobacteria bacterium]